VPLSCSVVVAREVEAPEGVQPVEWILLTDQGVPDLESVCQILDWYSSRWTIEDYHKSQKSGCGIETLQLTHQDRLRPVIALLSVVAVYLMQLRDAVRDPVAAAQPAVEVFPARWVAVLSQWRFGRVRWELTVGQFGLALARLGGHQNRRGDGPPGLVVLWRGWAQLQAMLRGAAAAEAMKGGESSSGSSGPLGVQVKSREGHASHLVYKRCAEN
jgi:hypothetical protein